jgi:DNA-binding PadR family transcriptional regulator
MDFKKRMLNMLLDIIMLKYAKDNGSLAGYDILVWVRKKHNVLLSSGVIYGKIRQLEKDGLVEGKQGERKKVYTLTEKGEEFLKSILSDPIAEQVLALLAC